MYKVEYINNELEELESLDFETFREALYEYLGLLIINWWDYDISELKIIENDKDITTKVNEFIYR